MIRLWKYETRSVPLLTRGKGLEGLAQASSERAIDFFLYRANSFLLLFLKCYYKINLSYKKRTQFE